MALANQIIDFVDDVGGSILKGIIATAPGDLAKTASFLTHDERERLEPEQFALVLASDGNHELRKFPITDAANTWLSAQYFAKTAEQLPFVAQKIAATHLARACALYNLKAPELVEKLAAAEVSSNLYHEIRDFNKTAAPVQSVAVKPDGSAHFFALGENYAMPSPEYTKKAAAYFVDHVREFEDAEDRHMFATNVLGRAKELNVSLEEQEQLQKFASTEYGDSVDTQIKLRRDLLEFKPVMADALDKLAAQKNLTEPQTFARALYLFDKKAGLVRYYDKYLADAFKATFADFYKSAGYRWENSKGDVSIDEKELVKAASNKYDRMKSYFGPTLADSLKKHAVSIFDSLPNDAKETIARIAKGEL